MRVVRPTVSAYGDPINYLRQPTAFRALVLG